MDVRSITTGLPKSSVAYVFGSFLNSPSPGDIDVLIIYDPESCPPSRAYELHKDFVNHLQSAVGIDVHIILLTASEEREYDFINDSGAVQIEQTTISKLIK